MIYIEFHAISAILLLNNDLFSHAGVYYLCDLLQKNPRLTDLNLSNKWPELLWEQTEHHSHPHISDHGATLLAEVLRLPSENRGAGGWVDVMSCGCDDVNGWRFVAVMAV